MFTLKLGLNETKVEERTSFERFLENFAAFVQSNPFAFAACVIAVVGTGVAVLFGKSKITKDTDDWRTSPRRGSPSKILNNKEHTLKGDEFQESIQEYESMFTGARKETGAITSQESVQDRKGKYATMINNFYNLVTDFYEWGWGQSFHFAPRTRGETFMESIKRAEYHLCSRLQMKPGMKVLDLGCGVGGPMRNMSIFSGSTIEGITVNQYQVNVGNKYNKLMRLQNQCKLVQGDFQELRWEDHYFDCAFEIEATLHSPDRVVTFTGVNRVLKPGGLFAGYEWVVTDKYDPSNADHVRIKEGIEVGNALPTLATPRDIIDSLTKSGFEIVEHYDANRNVHAANEIPWYDTLNGRMSLSGFRMTQLGRVCTHAMVWTLETLGVAPAGSTRVSALLNATAVDLCDAGKLEIFTPSYYFLARKK